MKGIFLILSILYASSSLSALNTFPFPESGPVGIRTISPLSMLDLKGNIMISNTDSNGTNDRSSRDTPMLNMSINFREPNVNLNYGGAAFRIATRSNVSPFFQWVSRQEKTANEDIVMSLLGSGNLGVGITNPLNKFVVSDCTVGLKSILTPRSPMHLVSMSHRITEQVQHMLISYMTRVGLRNFL